ncbi:MFS transporter [Herbiconiux daphne]|uniref:MFS transporter n=1 Tax=Herbiconiux daphne TaxID=2970914 RepID=A0ABT2GWM8_9MICO|nr:MFS transporter [Herbiconiux daphne]MCS5732369.1 MFS transporter [Herbiconiux daphne]
MTTSTTTAGGEPATGSRAAVPVSASPTSPAGSGGRTSWLGVASLGLGVFALVMAEFLPASLLSRIATDLRVSEGVAGQSVTVTAIVAALAGLALPVLLPRIDRRLVMLGLTSLAILSDLLVALAPDYAVLLVARILLGVAIGGFWALSLGMTAQLVPAEKLGRAMTVVNMGVSLATVAAIPLGAWLGELWGWRWVFALAAGVGVIALVVQLIVLPSVAPSGAPGFRALGTTLHSRVVLLGLVAIALIAGGHFSGFTYIRPAAESISHLDAGGLALLLLVYGIAAFFGNLISGPLFDRAQRVAVLAFPVVLGAGMLAFAASGASPVGVFAAVALWGLAFGGVPTVLQTWMARAEPDRLESVGGLVVAAFQVAIAVGAVVGGVLVDSVGVQTALIAGGLAGIAGGVLLVSIRRR